MKPWGIIPSWDLVIGRVCYDCNDTFELFGRKLASALAEIDIGLLADQIAITPPYSFYLCPEPENQCDVQKWKSKSGIL